MRASTHPRRAVIVSMLTSALISDATAARKRRDAQIEHVTPGYTQEPILPAGEDQSCGELHIYDKKYDRCVPRTVYCEGGRHWYCPRPHHAQAVCFVGDEMHCCRRGWLPNPDGSSPGKGKQHCHRWVAREI
jgi:hypothetical protein